MKQSGFFAIIGAIVTVLAIAAGVLYYLKKHGMLHCCCDDDPDDDLMEYIEHDDADQPETAAPEAKPEEQQ